MFWKTERQIEWKPEYSVGVKLFNEQHKMYFKLANDLQQLCCSSEPINYSILSRMILDFTEYAFNHLAAEEEIFHKYRYHYKDEHIGKHDIFRKEMNKFKVESDQAGADIAKIAEELAEYASDWLINHIIVEDKKYVQFMSQNGIS